MRVDIKKRLGLLAMRLGKRGDWGYGLRGEIYAWEKRKCLRGAKL
ncbi:hypothetical protein [Paenibacillus agricola]|nr:hypothetical protein [Paenibacillus agricola]